MPIDVAAVESLQADWTPGALPDVRRLPLRSVELLITVYQARVNGRETSKGVTDRRHAASLAALLKDDSKDLDPITILRVGKRNIVIDGHHRLSAYRSQKRKDIPVEWFAGSPKEAVIESGRENAKHRLTLTAGDRSERAWELVCTGLYSIAQIVAGSSTSKRRVSDMRAARKKYLSAGEEVPSSWSDHLRKAWDASDDEGESLKGRELVEKWVKALNASVGPSGTFTTTGKLSLFADALIAWGPHAMEKVFARLFYKYCTSDELLAYLEMEKDSLDDSIQAMKDEVDALRKEATRLSDSLSPF